MKKILFILTLSLLCAEMSWAQNVAKIGTTEYATLDAAIAAAQTGETIEIIASACTIANTSVIPSGVTITGQGKTATTMTVTTSGDGLKITNPNVTIKDMTIDGHNLQNSNYYSIINVKADGCLIDNVVTVDGPVATWGSAILVTDLSSSATVTVSNSDITIASRGLLRENCGANIVITNCDIDATYPFNINGGSGGTVTVTGGALHGWTSYGAVDQVIFDGVTFSKGTVSDRDHVVAYRNTTFTNCQMDAGFVLGAKASGFTMVMDDCSKGGVLVTSENVMDLFPFPNNVADGVSIFTANTTIVDEVVLVSNQSQLDGAVADAVANSKTSVLVRLIDNFNYDGNICGPASGTLNVAGDSKVVSLSNFGPTNMTVTTANGASTYTYTCANGCSVTLDNPVLALGENCSITTPAQTSVFVPASGYSVVETDNGNGSYTYTTEAVAADVVAQIGTTTYTSLADAHTAANDGETIVLLRDITLTETQYISKSITLDLAYKTISGGFENLLRTNADGLTVTIQNGIITNTSRRCVSNPANSEVNISNCTITAEDYAVQNNGAGTLNIENSTLKATKSNQSYTVVCQSGTVNLTDCQITANRYCIRNTNGTMNVTGGSMNSTNTLNGVNVYQTGTGVINIQDVDAITAKSNVALCATAGTINAENVNLISATEYAVNAKTNGTINITNCNVTAKNSAIYNEEANATVTINGGTVNVAPESAGTNYAINCKAGVTTVLGTTEITDNALTTAAVYCEAGTFNMSSGTITASNSCIITADMSFVHLTGGTYSEDVTGEMCDPGYAAFANGTTPETWTVVPAYNIYYVANNSTTEKDTAYVPQAEPTHTVQANAFTNTLSFRAWNTKADGTGTEFVPGATITVDSDTTLYAQWGKVFNVDNATFYDDLQTAIDAATAGDSLVVLADLNLTATIAIDKSLKINGGKHVIKTTSNRGLWFDAGSVTLNLKNFYLDGTNMIESSGIRGIQVDQNDVTLNMDSCRVYNVDEYAFWAFRDKMNLNVTVTNSYIEGMVVLKCYSSNSTFSFVNDTLYGLNPCATDMNYATIFIDGNYEPALGNDNSFSFEKCVIISEAWADCDPLWLGIAFSASGNNVTVDADTKIIDNEDEQNDLTAEMNFWLGGGKNYVTMPLSSVQIDSVEANFYTVTASGSNSVISAPVLWKGTKVTLVQPSFDKMFIDFHIPFDSNLLVAGDVLTLDDNITLKHDATLNINGDLKLNFKNGTTTYTITQGDYHVVLMEGSTVTTDMQNLALFTSPTGRVIETANGNNTYTYSMAKVYNATQNKGYSDLQPAIDAAAAGDSIVVLTDLNLTAYVDVNKSIIINGNNNTITSTATRGFRITQSNLNVTIRNLNEVCPLSPISQDYRGISFDLGLTNVNLLMDSCRFTGSDYAINLTSNNNGHIVTVKNSYIQGWAALNSFAQNTAFTFINDTLYGINKGNCSNNNTSMYYATICLDGGSLLGVTGTSNTTLDIQNSVVIAQENTDCVQRWIDVKYGASICEVSVDGNTKIIDGDENDVTSKIYVYGAKNTVTLPLTAEEKAVLAAKYYTLTDNPDGSTRVSHSIRYTQYLTANTMYIDFHYPFITHTLAAKDTIELLEDVTMSQEVYAPFVGNFTIHFKDGSEEHSITQGDYTIVLDDNQTCTTDKQALALFSSINGSSITETDNNNGTWTYSVTPYNIITYYSNNSAHEEYAQTKPNGETVNLYDYKTFDHADSTIYRWNTQADGNGTDYALGAAYSANADLDLYAVWLLNLNMTMDSTDVVCYGENNGTDTVKIIGGEAPFQIVLSSTVMADNDTVKNLMDRTYIFTNLKPGKYNVQLTDVLKKDTIKGTFTIAQPDTLEITALTVPEDFPCPLMGNGSYDVSVTAQGGNGGYHYTWSEAAVNIDAAATTVVSGADDRDSIYTVKVVVTDSKNCTAEGIKTFTVSKVIADDGTVHSNSKLTIDTIKQGIMSGCDTVLRNFGTPVFTSTHPEINEGILDTIYNDIPTSYPDSVFSLGENVVIWTAVDTCGHMITGEQIIIIYHYPCPDVEMDGYTYHSVRLACDCWTDENLKTTKYSDGRAVNNLMKYESPTHPDAEANFAIYGYLYDWTAALDAESGVTPDADGNVQGICPTGWHLPSDIEFMRVAGNGGEYDMFELRYHGYWLDGGGNNSTDFSLLPGGCYNDNTARYENILGNAYLWSVNTADPSQPKMFWADCKCYMWQVDQTSPNMGCSVRCVKD